MNAVNTFAVLDTFSDANHFSGAGLAGTLAGFSAFATFTTVNNGGTQHIMGNKTGNTGYRLCMINGVLTAQVGDGSAVTSLTATIAPGKMVFAELMMAGVDNLLVPRLFVNGQQIDSDVALDPYTPSAGLFSVGYDVNGAADPANATQISMVGIGVQSSSGEMFGLDRWQRVAASPGGALIYVPAGAPVTTAYRAIFENDGHGAVLGASAAWAPYLGSSPILTRVGAPTVRTVQYPWA